MSFASVASSDQIVGRIIAFISPTKLAQKMWAQIKVSALYFFCTLLQDTTMTSLEFSGEIDGKAKL